MSPGLLLSRWVGRCFRAAFPEKEESVLGLAGKGQHCDLMETEGRSITCKTHGKLGKSQKFPMRKHGGGRKWVWRGQAAQPGLLQWPGL